jgi:2-C-methyl-D-erythritol 4-phosphate cytidylyltransferase
LKKFAVIVAAGLGKRMGSNTPKQYLLLNGKAVLWYTLNSFLRAYDDMQIILVLHEQYVEAARVIADSLNTSRIMLTIGGETRFHSVKNGLKFVERPSVVFVHDAVRCLVSEKLIHQCYEETIKCGNAVPSLKSIDSLRIKTGEGNRILDRNEVYIVQTPQTFTSEIICQAFEQEYHIAFTDEASVVEKTGVEINLIEGDKNNFKVTEMLDLIIAEKILEKNGV